MNSEHLEKVIQICERVFGRGMTYLIMSFLERIRTSQYDYVILMSRKMYSFYRVFYGINDKRIYSSDAIELLGYRLLGRRVLVVDDTMIHGRTLGDIEKQLKKYGAKKVDSFVFIKEVDCDPFPINTASIPQYVEADSYLQYTKREWREFSTKMIGLFKLTQTPYRRSLPYMYVDSIGLEQVCRILREGGFIQSASEKKEELDEMHVTSVLFSFKNTVSCCANFELQVSCSSEYPERILLIPYVFLQGLEKKALGLAIDRACMKLPFTMSMETQARVVQFQTGYVELQKLKERFEHEGFTAILDCSDAEYTFATSVHRAPRIITRDMQRASWSKVNDESTILERLLTKMRQVVGRLTAPVFFMYAGIVDDLSVMVSSHRDTYLSYQQACAVASPQVIADLLCNGIVALSYRKTNSALYVRPCICPGELAFSIAKTEFEDIQAQMSYYRELVEEKGVSGSEYSAKYSKLFFQIIRGKEILTKGTETAMDFCMQEFNIAKADSAARLIVAKYIAEYPPIPYSKLYKISDNARALIKGIVTNEGE